MRTVMIFGTFDILHHGHLKFFASARKLAGPMGKVVAVVARDMNVLRIKGHAPFHTETERKEFLSHIDFISTAVLGDMRDVYKVIRRVKPDIIALGYDQKIFVDELYKELKKNNLNTKVVRLKPYKETQYKTKKIRQYLDEMI